MQQYSVKKLDNMLNNKYEDSNTNNNAFIRLAKLS